ncbi:unnamed protein product [Amaranthus hypochondriacus]
MPDPTNHPSLIIDPNNCHGAVDVNLSLNTAITLASRNQTIPVPGQVVSGHMDETVTRRLNLTLPIGFPPHSTSHSYSQPVNINIMVGNNNSVNISLRNDHPPSQFTRNNLLTISSNGLPAMNGFSNPASSHFQQPFLSPNSNQRPMLDRISETNPSPVFTRNHSQYASPIVPTMTGTRPNTNVTNYEQEILTAIPISMRNPRQNPVSLSPHQWQPSHPYHRVPSQNHTFSQRGNGLSFSQPSWYLPGELDYIYSVLENSRRNIAEHQVQDHDVGNDTFQETSAHPRPNHSTFPKSQPATEQVTEQSPEPNFDGTPLPQTEVTQQPPQEPCQDGNRNETRERYPQYRRHTSSMRYHPYTREDYRCPHCPEVFTDPHRYAAHRGIHYKDETPDERKKRRECKYQAKDLYLSRTDSGLTVLTGSLQEGEPVVRRGDESNQGEQVFPKIIKEEP